MSQAETKALKAMTEKYCKEIHIWTNAIISMVNSKIVRRNSAIASLYFLQSKLMAKLVKGEYDEELPKRSDSSDS